MARSCDCVLRIDGVSAKVILDLTGLDKDSGSADATEPSVKIPVPVACVSVLGVNGPARGNAGAIGVEIARL